MTIKTFFRSELAKFGWTGLDVGKHIVSYCSRCKCQRTFHCFGKKYTNKIEGMQLAFSCDFCKENKESVENEYWE